MKDEKSLSLIRNFSIIAHIDHGKSTLADRILESTGAITDREKQDQLLDTMDLERERGITIKLQSVRLLYKARDGKTYTLHLIDTPGHVDFSYEVSRSLQACEGALLVVDAAQGVEAQTLANVDLALGSELAVISIINKIDLPNADPERVQSEIEEIAGLSPMTPLRISAKEGVGIRDVLENIVHQIPPPEGDPGAPLRALVFDSRYDTYKGVIVSVRVIDGYIHPGMQIRCMAAQKVFTVTEVGVQTPHAVSLSRLGTGEVGFLIANIKRVKDIRVGDTITGEENPAREALPGYRRMPPMVFCGFYPTDTDSYELLREALEKLELNDSALTYEPETSVALGFGFRCGFLGLLHMEIVQERVEREYKVPLIATAPSVVYKVVLKDGEEFSVANPTALPPMQKVDRIEEPYVTAFIRVPQGGIGPVLELCESRRGVYKDIVYLERDRVRIVYELPLAEIVYDFFDRLKSHTRGFAVFDYEPAGYRSSQLVKLDILLNGESVDALSSIVHRDRAYARGKVLVERLAQLIPRQMFEVPVQAALGGRVIARETIRAMRKNVLAKCYGGDVSRKRKLLEKQKEGKKRMKAIGSIEIPQDAFMAVLRRGEDE
ncbi:translation elongation factor 4 [Pasteuria penetrans]|uniref:translation elongation factor 4 n=1 Tax=Pasteuria penetrans TaxID=86005 RepID=UPI002482C669|nr:translation elongation factor 4 [Pasteuria penetrans]